MACPGRLLRRGPATGDGIGVGVGSKSKVQGNESSANQDAGFLIRANLSQITKNVASGCGEGFDIRGPSDQLKVTQNRAIGNVRIGFRVRNGVTNSTFQKNYARGGADIDRDIEDNNAGCGSNAWKNNDFLTADPFDCIQ